MAEQCDEMGDGGDGTETDAGARTAYRYRRLSPAERAEVVRRREARGYPLHSPPHPFRHAGHFLITAANFEHQPLMASPERRTDFEAYLLRSADESGLDVCGWVILPNHYHLLVGVESLDQVSATLRQVHGTTSHTWNLADQVTGRRRVWYKFYDRMIRDEVHYYRALNYIHVNPVKHGYVDSPYDWPWMSVERYVQAYGRDWLRAMWLAYPPGEFGAGWDDID